MGLAPSEPLQVSALAPPPVAAVVVPLILVIALKTQPISSAVQRLLAEVGATADGLASVQGLQSPVRAPMLENVNVLTSI